MVVLFLPHACPFPPPQKVVVYPKATKTPSGALDVTKQDLSVSASVGQLRVVVLFLFLNQMLSYLKRFNVSEETISSVSESARKTAGDAVSAVSCLCMAELLFRRNSPYLVRTVPPTFSGYLLMSLRTEQSYLHFTFVPF